jgi:hypothetical protein
MEYSRGKQRSKVPNSRSVESRSGSRSLIMKEVRTIDLVLVEGSEVVKCQEVKPWVTAQGHMRKELVPLV